MITASHNPKQDNGYKLYWSNACQIIGPHDKAIQKAMQGLEGPCIEDWFARIDSMFEHPCFHPVPETVRIQYFEAVQNRILRALYVDLLCMLCANCFYRSPSKL
jgi:phosphoglucomutase